jgi:hypothetical protein
MDHTSTGTVSVPNGSVAVLYQSWQMMLSATHWQ